MSQQLEALTEQMQVFSDIWVGLDHGRGIICWSCYGLGGKPYTASDHQSIKVCSASPRSQVHIKVWSLQLELPEGHPYEKQILYHWAMAPPHCLHGQGGRTLPAISTPNFGMHRGQSEYVPLYFQWLETRLWVLKSYFAMKFAVWPWAILFLSAEPTSQGYYGKGSSSILHELLNGKVE